MDLLGKHADDLQSDIVIGDDSISGTLKAITDYTGFSGDVSEQSGNYIALKFGTPNASKSTIKVEIVGGYSGEVTLDNDRLWVGKIASTSQKIKVTASKTGYRNVEKTYTLTGLTLL